MVAFGPWSCPSSRNSTALPPVGLTLNVLRTPNQIQLSWIAGGFFLEGAPTITGPWNEVFGTTNPMPVPLTNTTVFYRLHRR